MSSNLPKMVALMAVSLVGSSCGGEPKGSGPSTRDMTDALFSTISANRDVYARHVVDRLQYQERLIEATEHFKETKSLPLPAQMLRMSAERVASDPSQIFNYSLLSLWPVNKQNGPRTEEEKVGMRVNAETGKNHYTEETIGGKKYFAAYYSDKGVVEACVRCHNDHKDSPRKDFRVGDVMGSVVIRVALTK